MSSSLPVSAVAGSGRRLFFQCFVKDPLRTGAQLPSSPSLARAMAQPFDPARPGGVLELGPGTGAVTRALLRRGFGAERILALEISPELVGFLRRTIPGLNVRLGDAFDLPGHLRDLPFEGLQGVVSSLPLLTQPVERRQALVRAALEGAPTGDACFVQYTYFFRPPVGALGTDVAVARTAFVPWNFYPATVWRYARKSV